MVTKGNDGRWYKPCPSCNTMQSYLRKTYAEQSFNAGKVCKGCSNKQTDNCGRGLYKDIRLSWFNKFRLSAEQRGLEFNLTVEELWQLFEEQDYRCALTGWAIGWSEVGAIHTASIDRVDSNFGYITGNVQIVHKDVNMSKQQFNQEYFVAMCKAVADKVKW
jgi:hypothetical protein